MFYSVKEVKVFGKTRFNVLCDDKVIRGGFLTFENAEKWMFKECGIPWY